MRATDLPSDSTGSELLDLARELGRVLLTHDMTLAVAESCTGGVIAGAVTSVPGSSQWFDRGFVTYSNEAKMDMLDVRENTLAAYGAVSEETAREMAMGVLKFSRADVSVAVTGIAGPGGGTEEKPVGMVCFGLASRKRSVVSETLWFRGDRREVRWQASCHATALLIHYVWDIS